MFTNWLTGSSSSNSSSTRSSSLGAGAGAGPGGGAGGSASALVMSSPPDVILEVGPAPTTSVRFVAHSLVLGMHSGYLRSAIRLDEAGNAASANPSRTAASVTTATGELLLYLSNVTADQFAPLLTYMYTGYLDLTVDNIFAVLLATHVLHMPRALEICRSFLARAQTEGYLNGNPPPPGTQLCPVAPPGGNSNSNAKVIRPIPSKATLPNYGFLPLAQAAVPAPVPVNPVSTPLCNFGASAAELQEEPLSLAQHYGRADEDEDEDVEVFIDSNTVTDNEAEPEVDADVDMDCNVSVVSSLAGSSAGSLNIERLDVKPSSPALPAPPPPVVVTHQPKQKSGSKSKNTTTQQQQQHHKGRGKSSSSRARKSSNSSSSSGLQVARAPVPAAQLEMGASSTVVASSSKFIIDVASCDGPVRFRRILNTAYGHKPEDLNGANPSPAGTGGASGEQHRSQQSVSYSFHQQMARAISSQQRQLNQQQQEESENSGDASTTAGSGAVAAATSGAQVTGKAASRQKTGAAAAASGSAVNAPGHQELFVCVYCKHTFKSQYCYQKHAKRHLNPLSLTSATTTAAVTDKKLLLQAEPLEVEAATGAGMLGGGGTAAATGTAGATNPSTAGGVGPAAGGALLRREVRPLDMNVQYYPCKTCGSKFPSYYFVHKHRKMCHAEEIEAAAAAAATNNNSSNSSSHSSSSNNKRESSSASVVMETGEDPQPQQQQQQQQHQQP